MEYRVQLPLALFPIHVLVALPNFRLRLLYERNQHGHINRLCLVVGRLIALNVSSLLKEIRLNVLLEVDFLGFHRLFQRFVPNMVGYRRVQRAALLYIFLLKVCVWLERKTLLLDKSLEGRILLVSGLTE